MTIRPFVFYLLLALVAVDTAWLGVTTFVHATPTPGPGPSPSPVPTPSPTPSPATALATTAKTYRDGLAQEFATASASVKNGTLKGPSDFSAFLLSHSSPLQAALVASAKAHADPTGATWADAPGMAADLQSVADTLGATK